MLYIGIFSPFLQIVVTDLRTISFDVPPQEILTKDSVTVAVDAVVYYKIQNPMAAVCNVSDYSKSTRLLASTTLRTILGTRNLSEILSDREHIASAILGQLDSATDPWGIKVKKLNFSRENDQILLNHDIFTNFLVCFKIVEFSREIKIVNSKIVLNHDIFTISCFLCVLNLTDFFLVIFTG